MQEYTIFYMYNYNLLKQIINKINNNDKFNILNMKLHKFIVSKIKFIIDILHFKQACIINIIPTITEYIKLLSDTEILTKTMYDCTNNYLLENNLLLITIKLENTFQHSCKMYGKKIHIYLYVQSM